MITSGYTSVIFIITNSVPIIITAIITLCMYIYHDNGKSSNVYMDDNDKRTVNFINNIGKYNIGKKKKNDDD